MSILESFSDLVKHLKDNTDFKRSNNVFRIIEFIIAEAL
jgi:hypothetical protein